VTSCCLLLYGRRMLRRKASSSLIGCGIVYCVAPAPAPRGAQRRKTGRQEDSSQGFIRPCLRVRETRREMGAGGGWGREDLRRPWRLDNAPRKLPRGEAVVAPTSPVAPLAACKREARGVSLEMGKTNRWGDGWQDSRTLCHHLINSHINTPRKRARKRERKARETEDERERQRTGEREDERPKRRQPQTKMHRRAHRHRRRHRHTDTQTHRATYSEMRAARAAGARAAPKSLMYKRYVLKESLPTHGMCQPLPTHGMC